MAAEEEGSRLFLHSYLRVINNIMPQLPQPKLSTQSAITIGTTNLEGSVSWYKRLGFAEAYRSSSGTMVQLSDGQLMLNLVHNPVPVLALSYFTTQAEQLAEQLKQEGLQFFAVPKPGDHVKVYVMKSPDGCSVSLVSYVTPALQPAGPGLLQMPQEDYGNPEKYVNPVCGMFGEFAQPVTDLDASLNWWHKLGFTYINRFSKPYNWAIISDGLNTVGLHQAKHFSTPTITYFAADMPAKIERLKAQGLDNYRELGGGNLELTTPEGHKIFLFRL